MNVNIVSATEIQRNFRQVLSKLQSSKEPLVVVRDSQPEAVLMSFREYQRLSTIEKQLLKEKMETILEDLSKRNKNFSDKEINEDIQRAKRAIRHS